MGVGIPKSKPLYVPGTCGNTRVGIHRGVVMRAALICMQNQIHLFDMDTSKFTSLLDRILAIRLNVSRLNSIRLNLETKYRIHFYTAKNRENVDYEVTCLRDEKGSEYTATDYQMAGLRLLPEGAQPASPWFDEWKLEEVGHPLQSRIPEITAAGKTLADLVFVCVAELKVRNPHFSDNTPVYEDKCYTGSGDYARTMTKLVRGKNSDFYRTAEYRQGLMEARDTLHATPLKKDMGKDENILRLPVFRMTIV